MDTDAIDRAAGYLAEAFETGNPLAPLPAGLAPPDIEAGEAVAEMLLERLGAAPCGLRLAPGPGGGLIAGPMLDGRLLPQGSTLATGTLRHASLTAAAIGVLAEPLDPEGRGAPVLAALHPGIDVAASRFRDGPASAADCVADLAGLGFVVAGARGRAAPGPTAVACAGGAGRPRGTVVDLAEGFAAAAQAARRLGGLPAGGLLVLAGLSPPASPSLHDRWTARLAGIGSAQLRIAADETTPGHGRAGHGRAGHGS